jgi:hypothetical protein
MLNSWWQKKKKNQAEKQNGVHLVTCTKRVRDGRRCPGQVSKDLLRDCLWSCLGSDQAESVPAIVFARLREISFWKQALWERAGVWGYRQALPKVVRGGDSGTEFVQCSRPCNRGATPY